MRLLSTHMAGKFYYGTKKKGTLPILTLELGKINK